MLLSRELYWGVGVEEMLVMKDPGVNTDTPSSLCWEEMVTWRGDVAQARSLKRHMGHF